MNLRISLIFILYNFHCKVRFLNRKFNTTFKHQEKHIDLTNKNYIDWINFLKDAEKWTKEQIREYQLMEIKNIVRYVYENTKGYRNLYDESGIDPKSIESFEDFQKIPFITKKMIRDNLEDFSVKNKDQEYVTTGGSTGIPFGFYREKIAFARDLASKAYQYYRIGWKEGDRQFVLRGNIIKTHDDVKYFPQFFELRCSSYHLTPENMEYYRKKAFEFKPDWLKCYPSSGYIFAKFLKENNKAFPPLKGILCASENLYDYQKEFLSKVFKTRVFSHYGHYELAALAGYCESEDFYHVLPQYGYVELIDKYNKPIFEPGKSGEIVATSFIMHGTPFIRYKTMDLAVLKGWSCPSCKRPYQVWEKVEGRLQEFIVTKKGRYISMTAMNMHDDIFDKIKQFQFYQKEKGVMHFRFIPKKNCNNDIIEDMKARLKVKLGSDIELKMESVEEILPTLRGKHRFLIQELKVAFGDD